MSTLAVVGWEKEQGGSSIVFDGSPQSVGVRLIELMQRDGVEKAMSVLVDEYHGWSSICGDCTIPELDKDNPRFIEVPGYGIAFTEDEYKNNPPRKDGKRKGWTSFDRKYTYVYSVKWVRASQLASIEVCGDAFDEVPQDNVIFLDDWEKAKEKMRTLGVHR